MNKNIELCAPISIGELFDKISILEIKREKIKGEKLKNIQKEIKCLKKVVLENQLNIDKELFNDLKEINKKLWEIEDNIRIKEKYKEFDDAFINLARSVYIENDKRSLLKKEINIKYGSLLIEEKSYES